MKKKQFLLIVTTIMICVVCVACSSSAKVEGTWYSVVDTTMYNFSEGNITVSGVVVGQYEDNGDSVVISLVADSTNQQLYVTKVDDIDVLADVKEGEGNIFFCKGYDNAQMFRDGPVIWKFKQYLKENLVGVWTVQEKYAELSRYSQIEVFNDGTIKYHYASGEIVIEEIVRDENGNVLYEITAEKNTQNDVEYDCVTLNLQSSIDGTLEESHSLWIWQTLDTFTNNTLHFGLPIYVKQQ